MNKHEMFKDVQRHKIVCAKCGLPWPCEPKKSEILARIKQQMEASKQP